MKKSATCEANHSRTPFACSVCVFVCCSMIFLLFTLEYTHRCLVCATFVKHWAMRLMHIRRFVYVDHHRSRHISSGYERACAQANDVNLFLRSCWRRPPTSDSPFTFQIDNIGASLQCRLYTLWTHSCVRQKTAQVHLRREKANATKQNASKRICRVYTYVFLKSEQTNPESKESDVRKKKSRKISVDSSTRLSHAIGVW